MSSLKKYRVKFFGSKQRKEQIKQVKMDVEGVSTADVEGVLRRQHGFEVINGLKINEYEKQEN